MFLTLFCSWLAGCYFWVMPSHGEIIQKEKSTVTNESLEQRGKMLREAIERTYKKMLDEKTLSANPRARNDISDVVVQYIPAGTSFDDAESILRSAGFNIDPRPCAKTDINPHGDVVASIVPFAHESLSKVNLYVFLSPTTQGDYSKVAKVYAGFSVRSL